MQGGAADMPDSDHHSDTSWSLDFSESSSSDPSQRVVIDAGMDDEED